MYPEQQAAWSILGWDAQGWDNMENEYSWNLAGEHLFCWEDGTPTQQDAAKSICFHQDTWNALMVNEHGMIVVNMHFLSTWHVFCWIWISLW